MPRRLRTGLRISGRELSTYVGLSEQANVWERYMVLFFQSTANDTVSSLPAPAPVQMQSLHIISFPPLYHPFHASGHSALHSYRGYRGLLLSVKLAAMVASWFPLLGSALSHLSADNRVKKDEFAPAPHTRAAVAPDESRTTAAKQMAPKPLCIVRDRSVGKVII